MALVGFQYEPVSLHVNEVCSEENQDIPNTFFTTLSIIRYEIQ